MPADEAIAEFFLFMAMYGLGIFIGWVLFGCHWRHHD